MLPVEITFGLIDSGMNQGLMVNLVVSMMISAPMKMMFCMISTKQISHKLLE
jgi:hypothetical protein